MKLMIASDLHGSAGYCRAMLEACDQLGMYIMDEGFDMWNKMKNYADFAGDFEDGWKKVLKAMVDLDYNHPSESSIPPETRSPISERKKALTRAESSQIFSILRTARGR